MPDLYLADHSGGSSQKVYTITGNTSVIAGSFLLENNGAAGTAEIPWNASASDVTTAIGSSYTINGTDGGPLPGTPVNIYVDLEDDPGLYLETMSLGLHWEPSVEPTFTWNATSVLTTMTSVVGVTGTYTIWMTLNRTDQIVSGTIAVDADAYGISTALDAMGLGVTYDGDTGSITWPSKTLDAGVETSGITLQHIAINLYQLLTDEWMSTLHLPGAAIDGQWLLDVDADALGPYEFNISAADLQTDLRTNHDIEDIVTDNENGSYTIQWGVSSIPATVGVRSYDPIDPLVYPALPSLIFDGFLSPLLRIPKPDYNGALGGTWQVGINAASYSTAIDYNESSASNLQFRLNTDFSQSTDPPAIVVTDNGMDNTWDIAFPDGFGETGDGRWVISNVVGSTGGVYTIGNVTTTPPTAGDMDSPLSWDADTGGTPAGRVPTVEDTAYFLTGPTTGNLSAGVADAMLANITGGTFNCAVGNIGILSGGLYTNGNARVAVGGTILGGATFDNAACLICDLAVTFDGVPSFALGSMLYLGNTAFGSHFPDPGNVRMDVPTGDGPALGLYSANVAISGGRDALLLGATLTLDGTEIYSGNYYPTTANQTAQGVHFGVGNATVGTYLGNGTGNATVIVHGGNGALLLGANVTLNGNLVANGNYYPVTRDHVELGVRFGAGNLTVGNFTMAITQEDRNAIADAVLSRSVSNVQGNAAKDSLAGQVLQARHASRSGLVLTIYHTDDVTVFDTLTLSQQAGLLPVTRVRK